MRSRNLLLAAIAPLLLLLASCSGGGAGDGGGGVGTGTLIVEATDAPLTHSLVDEAWIGVTEIRVHVQSDADTGFRTIYDGAPIHVNLINLRNGVRRILAQADLPAGSYRQVRLVLSEAHLLLTNGNRYSTDDGSLKLSSQTTSGLKVHIQPPVVVSEGLSRTLLLDFDLSKTFKPQPGNDPLNANSYRMHPVIRATNLSTAGEIRGVVEQDDGSGGRIGVDMATVHVLPPGETDPANAVASTATDPDGSYAVIGLAEGDYDVKAESGALADRVNDRVVVAGNFTVVDLFVQ